MFFQSTFFNVITKSAAPAENFPFCTIDPNEARVPVPDSRFDLLCEHHKPARWVSSLIALIDSHSRAFNHLLIFLHKILIKVEIMLAIRQWW